MPKTLVSPTTISSPNPHAAYLFVEEGHGYKGKRLYLTKIKEEENFNHRNTLKYFED